MKNLMNLLTIVMLIAGTTSFASGFICNELDSHSPLTAKLFNKTVGGTRVPAVMVVSDEHAGTILVAKGEEISKSNRLSTVRYTATPSNSDFQEVILQIQFKEGQETLEAGETVPGQLILINEEGEKSVSQMDCERYLKNK